MIRLLRHARARLVIDSVLDRLAHDPSRMTRAGNFLLRAFAPNVAAAVEFRAGNLAQTAELAAPGSRLARRSQEMLRRLEQALPTDDASAVPCPMKFNRRVLFVVHSTPTYDHNGYAVRSCQIVRSLNEAGVETVLAARLGYPWDLPGRFQYQSVDRSHHAELLFHHMRDPDLMISTSDEAYLDRYSGYLERLAAHYQCSVVHSNSNYLNGIAGARAARAQNCLAVYEMRGLWHVTRASSDRAYERSDHYRYCERMELEAARVSDRVVAISGALKDWLVDRGISEDKVWVVGNAADEGISAVAERRRRKDGVLRLGYVGSLVAYEGLDVLLHAIRSLIDSGVTVRLDVVGDGPDRSRLVSLSDSLGLRNEVHFLGRVPRERVAGLYAEMDACPLPRRRLPVTELVPPLKPFELMAHGVPVIASSLPPISEVVIDGETGLLCEPDSPQSLAAAIRRLVDHPELGDRLTETARIRILERHTWGRNAKVYLKMYSG